MCPKCKTRVHCGNNCCRKLTNGPYWTHTDDGLIVYDCCGFSITEDKDESLEYMERLLPEAGR